MVKARRCAKFTRGGGKCIRYKKVSVKTAKGIRQGRAFYKGDRVKKGGWTKKRWNKSQSSDAKRYGGKYESWEKKRKKRR